MGNEDSLILDLSSHLLVSCHDQHPEEQPEEEVLVEEEEEEALEHPEQEEEEEEQEEEDEDPSLISHVLVLGIIKIIRSQFLVLSSDCFVSSVPYCFPGQYLFVLDLV